MYLSLAAIFLSSWSVDMDHVRLFELVVLTLGSIAFVIIGGSTRDLAPTEKLDEPYVWFNI